MMNRRRMMATTVVSGFALPALGRGVGFEGDSVRTTPEEPAEFERPVAEGVGYFLRRCDDQLPLTTALESALVSGDLGAAQRAYVDARPPYEEIETLAYAFEDTDRDIDARPYAFEQGETAAEFRGFHKIEVLLFGYEDVTPAIPFARTLVQSIRKLRSELSDTARFNARGQFGGMFSLANEVAAKKISSEEETWSDQSLLIFKHNWIGIYSQFKPFARLVEAARPGVAADVDAAYRAAMDLIRPHFGSGAAGTPYSRIRANERRRMADASLRLRDAIASAGRSIGIEV